MTLTPAEERGLSLFLVAPAFVYLLALLVSGYTGWDGASVAGFVIIPLLLAIGLIPLWGPFIELLGFVAVTVIALSAGLSSPGGSVIIDFAAGILLGSPFLLGSWAWTPGRSAPGRLIGLGVALLEGIILLAALRLITANGEVENATYLFYNYTAANLYQICGLAGFLNVVPAGVCPSNLSQLPLRDLVDPIFVLLAGIALLGVLVPVLSPRTARGVAGDAASFEEYEASSRVRADLALSPEMMRGLATRTPPRTSPGLAPPGATALALSAGIVLVFVTVAVNAAGAVLFPTMVSLLLVMGVVLYLGRQGTGNVGAPTGRPVATGPVDRGPPSPASPPPSASVPVSTPAPGSITGSHPVLP